MSAIHELQPHALWQYFSAICDIPHPSFHEEQIREYLIGFAKEHNLEWQSDAVGNVIIRKQATPGMENRTGVILQGHMDMVPQKNNDTVHDFPTDPIKAYVDGDWVTAEGTTLGADNGIGMAATLAVLAAKDLQHGPVEVLFTATEETGMIGAQGLQQGVLEGKILLNLDTEEEGELYIGCAGGTRIEISGDYSTESAQGGLTFKTLSISGLKGGHSGCDIHLGRGNAIKLLIRVLHRLEAEGVRIASLNGGSLANAIPREASAVIAIPEASLAACDNIIDQCRHELSAELANAEPKLTLALSDAAPAAELMSLRDQNQWVAVVDACPNGAQRMSDSIAGVVETSLNLGVLTINEGKIKAHILPRSLVGSCIDALSDAVAGLFRMLDAEVVFSDSYPGWKPDPDSRILATMKRVYAELYGQEPGVQVVHAGLECGLLGSKYPQWDMISFGPTIRFPHSPDEKVHIQSVARFWGLLVATLKAIPEV
ncbi:aminoacyl-histidine dipeptidase [Endozoicomonas sp. SCSIO W0465]|uniref:aminoacyl-histidine dipeptidase n=1 Tax=Endozoicomonas sp. SCSIO W0465 TaxID=2918516 RepID=UPI002075DA94|nr:aminoacyl-histidine dipeptidase [Endozoicomonas sp. SCSIO W0465]USE36527.1 aminoacyl-histidine dipeptidase [Endozoicomonas sp. SCSIO W0465]